MPRAHILRTPGSILVPVLKERLQQVWWERLKRQQASKTGRKQGQDYTPGASSWCRFGCSRSLLLVSNRGRSPSFDLKRSDPACTRHFILQAAEGKLIFGAFVFGVLYVVTSLNTLRQSIHLEVLLYQHSIMRYFSIP